MLKTKEPVAIGKVLDKGGYSKTNQGRGTPDKTNPGPEVYYLFDKKYPNLSYWILDGAMTVKDKKVSINFSHQSNVDYFNENHDAKMRECCREFFGGENFEIEYGVDKSLLPDEKSVPRRVDDYPQNKKQKPKKTFPYKTKGGLDDLISFQGNEVAIEESRLILDLLEQGKEPQSIVYFEGPNGSGKTQIISSIGYDAFEKNIFMKYVRIRHILDHFRIHDGRSPALSEYLKDSRILVIDSFEDIFNSKGKPFRGVQSLIHELFDYASERSIQVILATTQEGGEIVSKLAEAENPALKDRVAGVNRVEMELPFDDRVDFLKEFIPSLVNNYPKDEGALEKLAQFYHNSHPKPVSMRDMAGTFLTASTIAKRKRTEITSGIVNSILYHQHKLEPEKSFKPVEVLSATVNAMSDFDVKTITGGTRTAQVVKVRNYVSFALDKLCGLNYSAIAKVIGKEHSTARNGIAKVSKKLDTNEKVEAFLTRVKAKIKK